MPIALIIIGLAALAVLGGYLIATPAAEPPKRARRRAPHNIPPAPCLRSAGFLARLRTIALHARAFVAVNGSLAYLFGAFILCGCIELIAARLIMHAY